MRRSLWFLILGLALAGASCNFPGLATPTPEASPTIEPKPLATATPTAVPTETPTPEPATGQICVAAYVDANQNAMQDVGEEPLAGVKFVVRRGGVEVTSYMTTDSSKAYCFENLAPGDYQVTAETPAGYQATNPTSLAVTLSAARRVPVVLGFAPVPELPEGEVRTSDGALADAIYASQVPQATFFVRTANAFYRTTNSGANWSRVGGRPPADQIVVSASNPDLLLAGDGFPCFRGGPEVSMFRSRDGGATWKELPGGLNLRPTAIDPENPSVAWAVGCDGAYLSRDGGESWTRQQADAWSTYTLDTIVPVAGDPRVVYAAGNSEGGSGAVFRSIDGGRTWQTVQERLAFWVSALLVHPTDPEQAWFATPSGVYRTTDGGASWDESSAGLEAVTYSDDKAFDGIGLYALARDTEGLLYLGTEQGLYASRDGGATWEVFRDGPGTNLVISKIVLGPADARLWLETPSGVYAVAP
jgi:photosystem II stability/assembly factor-like uncharacterized protein